MANGMPVLSTDQCTAALHFIQNGENGYIYKVDDAEDYIKKLEMMCSNLELLDRMSKRNVSLIQEYSIERMAEQHLSSFIELQKKIKQ